ncbi:MAG: hypothetical protein AAF211_24800 [Myxococcota bacterium]
MSIDVQRPSALVRDVGQSTPRSAPTPVGPSFAESLDRLLDTPPPESADDAPVEAAASRPVVLSRHAEARLASRGIDYGPEQEAELRDALNTLDGRGAQKALVLTGQQAWIVGVPKRTVITVMSREEALGQVFTDLDSTYLAG